MKQDTKTSKRMRLAFLLNAGFTVIEIIGGILTGSIAIVADAIHDLGDSLSLGASWLLEKKSNKEATEKFPFGYKRFSLLGALLSGTVLITGSIYIFYEAGKRLFNPVSPHSEGMMWLAILGVLVNGFAALKLRHGEGLNSKMLSWHLLEDVLGWVAVLVVSIILQFKDIPILDPLLSIGITIYILFHVIKNLKKTLLVLLESTPEDVDMDTLKNKILKQPGVIEIQKMHLWTLDGKENTSMIQLLVVNMTNEESNRLRAEVREILKKEKVTVSTLEVNYLPE
ncbi:cation transporter [Mesobacillus boroniphilus]|uniref:Cation transporter n=1 Tax=Mesobacillus boroniphilus TaxID=308892 RepID=A0A944CPJ3_9BACI|nr:cation diffusion facilitator family transporter [Mesobacillus boroniphilus]MBS8266516.1 cation transporter [Mesobacillus boroniphilus]